jgi:uncharacterized membrane protein SpoIIM required for sporulation
VNIFLKDEKDNWRRLEDLLGLMKGTGLRGLSRVEVREFGELYRRAAADLAIARAETRDPKLINYLNSLVIRAHGKIYRAESEGAHLIVRFFAREFPETFRANWRYFGLAFGAFTAFALIGFFLCAYGRFDEVMGLERFREAAATDYRWWLSINGSNQIESSAILTNNIQVSIYAFALGAFFGIGAFYILVMNGLMIGGVVGTCFKVSPAFANELVTFMVGHGVIELSCVFMAAGAGMMIGYSIINPGDLTRGQALKKKGMEAAKLVMGCAVLLVIAGTIEGFLSPSNLPAAVKFGTGIGTGVAMYSYLFLVGGKQSHNGDDAAS